MIDAINHSAATIIEGLQPFNNGGATSNLYILNDMWKRDKHRLFNFIGVIVNAFKRIYLLPDGTNRQFLVDCGHGKFKDGTEIVRITFPDFYQPPEVRMIVTVEFNLEFWDAGKATGQSVVWFLESLVDFGGNVIERLATTI